MAMTDSMPIDALNDLQAANSARGEAVAFIDVAGYRLKLGFDRLKWLLQDERWRRCVFRHDRPLRGAGCPEVPFREGPSSQQKSKRQRDSGTTEAAKRASVARVVPMSCRAIH
jgi:hypothetical protein